MRVTLTRDLLIVSFMLAAICGNLAADTSGDYWERPKSKEPVLITRTDPEYPPLAKLANISALIDVNILVGTNGAPVKTEILQRNPPMAYLFDDAVRKCVMGWTFRPAIDPNGIPIPFWVAMPISLEIRDFTAPSCDSLAAADYPVEATQMGLEGWVGLMVLVDKLGRPSPEHIYIVDRPPHQSEVFDASARAAALKSRFTPARLRAGAVDGWCFVTVEFKIPGE